MLQNRQPRCNMAKARVAASPKSKSPSHKKHKNPQKYKLITSIHALSIHHPTFLRPLVFLVAILSAPVADLARDWICFQLKITTCLFPIFNLQSSILFAYLAKRLDCFPKQERPLSQSIFTTTN
jgi:hypothetical protein